MKIRKSKLLRWVIIFIVVLVVFIFCSRGMNSSIPNEEQEFIDTVLVQINFESTLAEIIELLGEPSRNLGLKVNWVVTINEKESRIGVYFSSKTGTATTVNFDGGVGRFYYRKDLEK